MSSKRPGTSATAGGNPPGPRPVPRPLVLSVSQRRTLLAGILLFAAFLRLYQLDTAPRGLYRDEAMNGNNALQILETGRFQVFYPENNGREGLFINVAAPFVYCFGNTALAIRLPAAIFGILTVWGVYLLAAELFSAPVALTAAFFVATSYWHLTFSRMALRANAAGFFLAWSLFLLVAAARRLRAPQLSEAKLSEAKTRAGSPGLALILTGVTLAGVTYGLGFYTYIAYRATPALVAGMLICYWLQARKEGWTGPFWKGSIVFVAATALVTLPLLLYFARNPGTFFGRTSQVSVMNDARPAFEVAGNLWKTALMFFVSGDTNWRHNYDGQPEVYWPVAILFALGTATAIGAARRGGAVRNVAGSGSGAPNRSNAGDRGGFPHLIMLGWLVIAAAPVVLSNDAIPHALRSVLMIPPVFVLAAVGAHRAYSYSARKSPSATRLAAAALCVWLCYQPYHTYFNLWVPHPKVASAFDAGLIDLAEQVNALPASTPKYIAVATGGDLANGTPLSVAPVVYLTRSYTRKQQDAANIHYVMPKAGEPAAGFCEKVGAEMPGAAVFCVR